jgi:hypothetical protein
MRIMTGASGRDARPQDKDFQTVMASRAVREGSLKGLGCPSPFHWRFCANGQLPKRPGIRPADLLFLDLLDFREEVPECGDTTSASAG